MGAQCDVNFGGSGGDRGVGGGNNGGAVPGNNGFGGGNNGFGGVPGGSIETVNCGQGVSRTSASPDGVIQVICSNGNTVMNCSNTKNILTFLYIRKPPTAKEEARLCDPMMDIKSLYSVVAHPLEELREDEEEEIEGEEEEEEEE